MWVKLRTCVYTTRVLRPRFNTMICYAHIITAARGKITACRAASHRVRAASRHKHALARLQHGLVPASAYRHDSPSVRRELAEVVAPVDARHERLRRFIIANRASVIVTIASAATASSDAIAVEYRVVTMREARTQRRRRLGRPYPPPLPPVEQDHPEMGAEGVHVDRASRAARACAGVSHLYSLSYVATSPRLVGLAPMNRDGHASRYSEPGVHRCR